LNTAPKETLVALGLPDRTADKLVTYRLGPDGKPGTPDDTGFTQTQGIVETLDKAYSLDGEERARLADLILAEKVTTVSSYFSAKSVAKVPNGASLEIEAVFDRSGKIHTVRTSGVKWPSKA
jgi:hypothetical protein